MQVIIDYIKENKTKLLVAVVLIIILIVVSIIVNLQKKDKIYGSESYVYTKEIHKYDNGLVSELPYINITGEGISEINNSLIKKYYEIITVDDRIMDYISYKSENIISLIVNINFKESPDSYPSEVLIYNVDIENGNVIDDKQLLSLYGVSKYDVSDVIKQEIKEYYLYEIKHDYVNNDCDFNCYLDLTKSLPLDNCKYYIKDNTLMAYKSISVDSNFFYDVNSGFYLFNFKIKEK